MIELKRVLVPVDDTPFNDICSFETESYIGAFVDHIPKTCNSGFVVMPKDNYEFSLIFVDCPDSLEKLDDMVYDRVDEHIESVSTSRCLDIKINEDY